MRIDKWWIDLKSKNQVKDHYLLVGKVSMFIGSWEFAAEHFIHFGDDVSRGQGFTGLPSVDLGFLNAHDMGELLLCPAFGVSGLWDGKSEILWHWWG
jgi:hypothetical protein